MDPHAELQDVMSIIEMEQQLRAQTKRNQGDQGPADGPFGDISDPGLDQGLPGFEDVLLLDGVEERELQSMPKKEKIKDNWYDSDSDSESLRGGGDDPQEDLKNSMKESAEEDNNKNQRASARAYGRMKGATKNTPGRQSPYPRSGKNPATPLFTRDLSPMGQAR